MKVQIPYTPRPLQNMIHSSLKRFNVIVCHRRFGKTVFCINEIIRKALLNPKRRPQYAYIAPTIKQAKLIAWDYVKQYTSTIPGIKYNESELRCELPNGAKVFILGAENPDSLRGLYLDGVIMDEVAQMAPSIWGQVVRPALADRKGWAVFIGTPKGQNYFYDLYNIAKKESKWFHTILRASETKILDGEELAALRAELSEAEYNQEMECDFTAAVQGTYYGSIMNSLTRNKQVTIVPYNVSAPVVTAWDLGINDKTCIWFAQIIGSEIRIIDYLEGSGEGLEFYAKAVREKPYAYDYHILPHDARQRSIATGKTRIEQLQSLGLKCVIAPRIGVKDGINSVRTILPNCFFDKEKCAVGIVAMSNYRSAFNESLGIFSETPLHDKYSHAADAFRYLAITLRKPMSYEEAVRKREKQQKYRHSGDYDPYDY